MKWVTKKLRVSTNWTVCPRSSFCQRFRVQTFWVWALWQTVQISKILWKGKLNGQFRSGSWSLRRLASAPESITKVNGIGIYPKGSFQMILWKGWEMCRNFYLRKSSKAYVTVWQRPAEWTQCKETRKW